MKIKIEYWAVPILIQSTLVLYKYNPDKAHLDFSIHAKKIIIIITITIVNKINKKRK